MPAKTLLNYGNVGGQANTASTVEYWTPGGGNTTLTTTENNADVKIQLSGSTSKLFVRTTANTGTHVLTSRDTGNAGTMTVTINAVGTFEDTTHSDTISSTDRFAYSTDSAANTCTITVLSCFFTADTDTSSIQVLSFNVNITTASTTWFAALAGKYASLQTTETFMKTRQRLSGTFKRLGAHISANRAQSTTVRLRKNAGNGNNVATITGGGGAGWYEDTTNSDTVSAAEDWDYSITSGTGVDTLTINVLKCEFVSTNGDSQVTASDPASSGLQDANTSAACPLGGRTGWIANSSEANAKMKARAAFDFSQLTYVVSQNDVTSASTGTLAKNGADATNTFSITGSATGPFSDTTHTDTVTTTDDMNFRLTVPSVSGTHTVTTSICTVWVHLTPTTDYTRAPATETVSSTESITRLLAAIRTNTETTTSTETLNRGGSIFNRALATETTTITDQLDKLRTVVRPITTETVTSSESIARKLDAIRNPVESTTSSETLARMIAANRSTATESTTISDVVARVKELPRSLVETVTSSDSVVRMLAANRTISESTTITDSVSRMLAAIRALLENTVVADTVNRMLAAIRAIGTEVISITDSVVRVITPAGNNFVRSITETVVISDSVSRMLALTRVLTETVNSSETLTRLLAAFRTISESTTITDSISRLLAMSRSLTETTTITDSVARLAGKIRALIENTSVSESITRRFVGTRPITETTVITDSLTRVLTRLQIPTMLHNLKEYIISKYSISDPSL